MSREFPHLFRSGRIGTMVVKNRIFMAPMATGFCESDGRYSQRQIDWYVTRARGGAGLIETEACAVEREISKWPSFPSTSLESALNIPRAHELTSAVHDFGAKISAQLSIGQGRCLDRASAADPPVSASAVPALADPSVPCRPLTVDEIRGLTRSFADACERAVCAGFDLIWIHNHGGYLLDQFMSPLWNRRDDEYGGDLDGRLRFPLEIIRAARARVGPTVPIGFRMAIDLKLDGSRSRAEGLEMCRRL
jgi:2,4-dienoyl-CoA reductase-like NADH-dependent reductase (Old Yellow Enzyme family)